MKISGITIWGLKLFINIFIDLSSLKLLYILPQSAALQTRLFPEQPDMACIRHKARKHSTNKIKPSIIFSDSLIQQL